MKKYFNVYGLVWVIPFLMGLLTLGMDPTIEGTDLGGQVYNLGLSEMENPWSIIFDTDGRVFGLYYPLYIVFHRMIGLAPMQYIALISFTYYLLVLLILKWYINYNKCSYLRKSEQTYLVVFTVMSFSPIFICITRFLFAVNLVLLGFLLYVHRHRLIGVAIALSSIYAHEGMKMILAIIIVAFVLNKLWLARSKSIGLRNTIIISVSAALLVLGVVIFIFVGEVLVSNDMVSEKYTDLYITAGAGDGMYKVVILLAMAGTLAVLIANCLKYKKSDWLHCLCVASLFTICLLVNQKVFYVQRIMMFMPVFLGVSTIHVLGQDYSTSGKSVYRLILLSVPAICLAQFFFWRQIFFSWL